MSLDEKKVNLLHINKLFLNLTLTMEKLNIYYNKNICKKICKPFFRITEVFYRDIGHPLDCLWNKIEVK